AAAGAPAAGCGPPAAAGVVDEPEIELGPGPRAQPAERRIVRLVDPIARHGQVDPVEWTTQAPRQHVGDVDELARIRRLLEMTVPDVAVAEGITQLDVPRGPTRQPPPAREGAPPHLPPPHRKEAPPPPETQNCLPHC